ncbi:MAG: hypothetical protein IJ627_01915 [Bacteroidales bacterium]|nr:hypothetical protein [Bacteroidales bacterium]
MTKVLKYFLPVAAALFFSIIVPAAVLPTLPDEARFQRGTLGSGVSYYMVPNTSARGYADIAIVRRDEAPTPETLSSLDPGFFSRMGIEPGREGYVRDTDGSTVIRYRNLAFYDRQVLDSTLLFTFSQIALSRAEQAIIVSGDIDPVELKKKMDIFSMLVPRIMVTQARSTDYVWEPSPAPSVTVNPPLTGLLPQVRVSYASARTPQRLMNTAQLLVTGIMGQELKVIALHRLERNLRDAGVPYSGVDFVVIGSESTSGDESYSVIVRTGEEHLDAAMKIIASTLGELDSFGAGETEFIDAKRILTPSYRIMASRKSPSREEDVTRCISNFLYGAPLAPSSENERLFARKMVPDSLQTRHFNNFAGAIVEQLSNLTLSYRTGNDSLDRDDALFQYNLAYLYGSVAQSGKDYTWHYGDTLGMEPICPKIKIKTEKADPVTGGKIWTFTNGIKVVYKEIPGSRMFGYSYVLGGGLSKIDKLRPGEGGYIADVLSLYDAGGLSAPAFRDVVKAGGLQMEASAGVNSTMLYGRGMSNSFPFFLKALVSIAGDKSLNRRECDIYLRNRREDRISPEDSMRLLMAPEFACSLTRNPEVLDQETIRKADEFFREHFSRMNDGTLIIAGDLQESEVKKALCRYLGALQTVKVVPLRPYVEYQPIAGTKTFDASAFPAGIRVLMDTDYPVTALSYYTAQVAEKAIEKALVRHLAPYGFSVSVKTRFMIQPQERYSVYIECLPANPAGLPRETGTPDAARAISAVRAAIKEAAGSQPSALDLNAWKHMTLSAISDQLSQPEGIAKTLTARYAGGKDITSRYVESIGAISADNVTAYINALARGGRIEFIGNGK